MLQLTHHALLPPLVLRRGNNNSGQPFGARLDNNGSCVTPHNMYHGGFPCPGTKPGPCMVAAMAPMVMTPMGLMSIPQAAPPFWQPATTPTTIAIVGDPVNKEDDKWSEYEDEDGTPFYHNPARPDETTWEKPQDFDKQKNEDEPPPPTKPKEKGPKYR